jgi:cyclic beta-1,2-glucan synthetase
VEHILGLRLMQGDLLVAPCLPKAWKRFEARITRPTGVLVIRVEDPEGLGTGKVAITVDGERRTGDTLKFPTDGTTRLVHVRICPAQAVIRDSPLTPTGVHQSH